MSQKEILKMLFEEHHRQYTSRWKSVSNSTNATIATYILITSWTLISKTPPTAEIKPFIIGFVTILASITSISIIASIPNIKSIAQVIEKINLALGLYEKGKYLDGESLYPDKWKNFGSRHHYSVVGNCILIWCSCTLCISAIYIRN